MIHRTIQSTDNLTFKQAIEAYSGETEYDNYVSAFLAIVNDGNENPLNDKHSSYLADCLITKYGNEYLMYSGENGLHRVVLLFKSVAPRFRDKMNKYEEILALTEDELKTTGATLSNYAETPNGIDTPIDSGGKLEYISNQTYDENKIGKLQAIADKYNNMIIAEPDNYVKKFSGLFGQLCYYSKDKKDSGWWW